MPHVFSAVVPHSPLLIPEIAKEHRRLIQGTTTAIEAIQAECYAAQPDVLVFLSPHGPAHANFIAYQSDVLEGDLREFGNLSTKVSLPMATGFVHRLKAMAHQRDLPFTLQTMPQADYGTIVPGHLLFRPNTSTKIAAILLHQQDVAQTIELGNMLQDFLHEQPERCALIASADLQRRTDAELVRFHDRPTPAERTIAEAISAGDPTPLTAFPDAAVMCGIRPILALLAAIRNQNIHGAIRSFEAPFGVGLMVASFQEQ